MDFYNLLHAYMFFVLLVCFSNVLLAGLSNFFLAAFSTEKNFPSLMGYSPLVVGAGGLRLGGRRACTGRGEK